MLTPTPASWTVRGATFALWLLAAATAAFWALKVGSGTITIAAPVTAGRAMAAVDPAAIARLLGSASPLPAAGGTAAAPVATLASRFTLLGVAAEVRSGRGAAVISVDGKPARPYRVGSALDEGLVLQSVKGRQAVIAQANGQPVVTLELPPPPRR
jgi:general secretion pathway protein C